MAFRGIKRNLYSILTAGALGLGSIVGCDKGPTEISNPPQNSFSVSPPSGMAPLPITIRGNGSDPDGDLKECRIYSGGNLVTKTNPIDSLTTLTQTTSFISECEDMAGHITRVGPYNINVTQPPVNHTPQTSLILDSTPGVAPVNKRIQYACTDQEGAQDIDKSYLIVGTDTIRTNSIDSTFALNQPTQVKGYCKDKGGLESSVGPVNIQVSQPDFLDISGQLQDLRTKTGSQGEIILYSFSDSSVLAKDTTDANGNFSFNFSSAIPGDSVYLQARLNAGTPDSNFTRTEVLPNRDISSRVVRAYPYNSELSSNGISRNGIRSHLQEINPGFDKLNLDSLMGAGIVADNPGKGNFTLAEQDAIEQTFKANMACYTGGRLTDLNVQRDQSFLDRGRNWIYIFPDTTIGVSGMTNSVIDGNGNVINSIVRRNPNLDPSSYTDAHEQGHAFIGLGHATTLPGTVTIMRSSQLLAGGPADCEAGKIIYEPTFAPREQYDRILGLSFFPKYYQ